MSANTLGADINEIRLAWLLNGNSYPDQAAQSTYVNRETSLIQMGKTQEIADQCGRADAQYQRFLTFLRTNNLGTPVQAYWTARPGIITSIVGFSVDQRKNPTDVLVKLNNDRFYGISLKSTKSGKTGFKNPGMGSLETSLGLGTAKPFTNTVNRYRQLVSNHLGSRVQDSDVARKNYFRQNDQDYQNILSTYAYPCYEELRQLLYDHLSNKMDPWEHQVFLGADLMNEDDETMRLPYVKITGSGKNGNYTASFYDPIADSKMIKIISHGASFELKDTPAKNTIQVKAGTESIFQIRWKWSDRAFASSMKLSAE